MRVGLVYEGDLDADEGVAHYVRTLAAGLRAANHDVTLLTAGPRPGGCADFPGGYSLAREVRVPINGNHVSVAWRASSTAIRRAIRDAPLDVLHIHVPHSPVLTGAMLRRLAPSTAVVATCHMTTSRVPTVLATRLWRRANRRSLARIDTSIAVSTTAAKYAREVFGVTPRVIPAMIEARQAQGTPERAAHVLFVGRLVPRKGAETLIEAFAALPRPHAGCTLVIAGDGPLRPALERRVRRLGIQARVTFAGHVTEAAKFELLAAADIACFPSSDGESFGVVLLEAMAAGGCVVLAGDNPGYSEVLDNHADLLVESGTLTARLDTLLADQALRERLCEWQQEHVQRFTVPTVLPQILDVYRQATRHDWRHELALAQR
ncbi:glycosyltransferase family 4 protein [Solirubrobacter phytolaccae]|uniref:Glycosyltransferase family 4 protein n=1 Tax=Solirubrobacter phytolaccae TaxID=1404360 RepID=A0A9X3N3Q4_9ACTN|nr:glycosyltransferase family 4 protein [Solirubrobacter phytolaccae]MDA0179290.1 glycosyltransferase family 4 protein [Solirubrobacter phytolaccae]